VTCRVAFPSKRFVDPVTDPGAVPHGLSAAEEREFVEFKASRRSIFGLSPTQFARQVAGMAQVAGGHAVPVLDCTFGVYCIDPYLVLVNPPGSGGEPSGSSTRGCQWVNHYCGWLWCWA
jgi:hypothetical protein